MHLHHYITKFRNIVDKQVFSIFYTCIIQKEINFNNHTILVNVFHINFLPTVVQKLKYTSEPTLKSNQQIKELLSGCYVGSWLHIFRA